MNIFNNLSMVAAGAAFVALGIVGAAQATTLTTTSPAGGQLPNTVSEVGGVVLDLVGTNNTRVVSQLPASTLFRGYYNGGTPTSFRGNPGTIGIQTGFGPSVTGALGGGLQRAAIRITLFDGDTAANNFDFNQNILLVNGLNFGNFSTVNAQATSSTGSPAAAGSSGGGFRNNILDTGFFSTTDPALLTNLFNSLVASQQVQYQVNDLKNVYDNYFDFTQGVDSALINVGQPPTTAPVTPPTTEIPFEFSPSLGLLMLGAWGAITMLKTKVQKQKALEVGSLKINHGQAESV